MLEGNRKELVCWGALVLVVMGKKAAKLSLAVCGLLVFKRKIHYMETDDCVHAATTHRVMHICLSTIWL